MHTGDGVIDGPVDVHVIIDERATPSRTSGILWPFTQFAEHEGCEIQRPVLSDAIGVKTISMIGDEQVHHRASVVIIDELEIGYELASNRICARVQPVSGSEQELCEEVSWNRANIAKGDARFDTHIHEFDVTLFAPPSDELTRLLPMALVNPDATVPVTPRASARLEREIRNQSSETHGLRRAPVNAIAHHGGSHGKNLALREIADDHVGNSLIDTRGRGNDRVVAQFDGLRELEFGVDACGCGGHLTPFRRGHTSRVRAPQAPRRLASRSGLRRNQDSAGW